MSKGRALKGNKGGAAKSPAGRGAKPAAAGEGKRRRGRPPRTQGEHKPAAPGERMIHRYGNRRFYDLAQSRAITLAQIGELVRQRQMVRVLDVERGNEDITRRVLAQILIESGEQLDLVPVEFLRKLIIPAEKATAGWIRQYLGKGLELLERVERQNKSDDGSAQNPSAKIGVEFRPAVDYRQQMAKADITRQIDELRRKLDGL